MQLTLETKVQPDETPRIRTAGGATLVITPPIKEDYWLFRVRLSAAPDAQAIVGFPKFNTIGVGFAKEQDWNTNLPYTCGTEEIYNHIKHNKGDQMITKATCLAAIRLVQDAAAAHKSAQ